MTDTKTQRLQAELNKARKLHSQLWDDWPDDTHKGIFMWGKVGVTPIDGYQKAGSKVA